MKAFFADEIFRGAAVRAVADEDEFGGHFGADNGEDFDDVGEALDGAEIGEMHEDGLAVGRPLFEQLGMGLARVEIAVDEIGDDFDGALDVELFEGLLQEVLRDGGDAVGLLDGKFCDGEIAAIAADERDVGAVKSGDEGETARERPWSGQGGR